jgi:ribose 5-phosphate isomerase B
MSVMRVAFGTDEHTEVSEAVQAELARLGHDVIVLGDGAPWTEVGRLVGEAVAGGHADRGVVCCWTGTGVSIAANKVNGVRAALCTDAETARGARRWNDANVLALGLRLTSPPVAKEMLETFFATPFDETDRDLIAGLT